ncbi:hypothetical protein ACRAWG_35275 [Methylobacterium sp. P31]
MANRGIAFEAEAGAVTFVLLSSAFHELAAAVRAADPKEGRALLLQLEESIVAALRQFEAYRPELAGSPILYEAARRVCGVMQAAAGPAWGGVAV